MNEFKKIERPLSTDAKMRIIINTVENLRHRLLKSGIPETMITSLIYLTPGTWKEFYECYSDRISPSTNKGETLTLGGHLVISNESVKSDYVSVGIVDFMSFS